MDWDKTTSEFNSFASEYEWLFGNEKAMNPIVSVCRKLIDRVQPRTILDCACGAGWSSIALKKEGRSVLGTDISEKMITLARANAKKAGVKVKFAVAAWHQLPERCSRRFDLVMCHGNAIGHCHGERAMLKSLRAMREMARVGAYLYLDTRSWEWARTKCPRFFPSRYRKDIDGDHTVVTCRTTPKSWHDPHRFEMVHIVQNNGKIEIRSYPITFYAFKISDLLDRLHRSGFGNIKTDYNKNNPYYSVVAQAV
jgi:glycine/sarcosine N-methyltransferase